MARRAALMAKVMTGYGRKNGSNGKPGCYPETNHLYFSRIYCLPVIQAINNVCVI